MWVRGVSKLGGCFFELLSLLGGRGGLRTRPGVVDRRTQESKMCRDGSREGEEDLRG